MISWIFSVISLIPKCMITLVTVLQNNVDFTLDNMYSGIDLCMTLGYSSSVYRHPLYADSLHPPTSTSTSLSMFVLVVSIYFTTDSITSSIVCLVVRIQKQLWCPQSMSNMYGHFLKRGLCFPLCMLLKKAWKWLCYHTHYTIRNEPNMERTSECKNKFSVHVFFFFSLLIEKHTIYKTV